MIGLGVFLKYPEPGRVKTRLAKDVGNEKATQLYRWMIQEVFKKTLKPLLPTEAKVYLFVDPFRPVADYETEFQGFPFVEQVGADLGERMKNAFEVLISKHPKAAIIGTDTVSMSHKDILQCSDKLQSTDDLVLGPAMDGGYYLIGLKKVYPELFEAIEWSSPKVLGQTKNRAGELGLTSYFLSKRRDLDTLADIQESGVFPANIKTEIPSPNKTK